MEIIKRGQLPEMKKYRTTCQNCKTEFAFHRNEARIQSERCETVLVIKCPLAGCGRDAYLNP